MPASPARFQRGCPIIAPRAILLLSLTGAAGIGGATGGCTALQRTGGSGAAIMAQQQAPAAPTLAASPRPTPGEIVGWAERSKVEYTAVASKTVGGPKLPPQGFRAIGKNPASSQVFLRYTALFGDFANLGNPSAMDWKGRLANSEPAAAVEVGSLMVWGSWWGDWPWVRGRRLSGGGTVFASSSAGYQEILAQVIGAEPPAAVSGPVLVLERMFLLSRMPKGADFKVVVDPTNTQPAPGPGPLPPAVVLTEPSYVELTYDPVTKAYGLGKPVLEKDWSKAVADFVAAARAAKVSYESATK